MIADEYPTISVVIPVKGGGETLEQCLTSIYESKYKQFEVLVVDDGMEEGACCMVGGFPCRRIRNLGTGVSAARNTGACEAVGEVLFFVDSDIVIRPNTLGRIGAALRDPAVDGVVGLLSRDIPHQDFYSQFKNLWMHYTYFIVPDRIALFYTSVAAIRRRVFLEAGGFDENYCRPSVEDTDFGHKLGKTNASIRSDKEMEVIHLKRYTFWDIMRTDFYRSSALVKHVRRSSRFVGLNRLRQTSVPVAFMLGVGISLLFLAALPPTAALRPSALPALVLAAWVLLNAANARFLIFLLGCKGLAFMLRSCLFLPLDILSVDFGILHGFITFWRGKRY